MQDTPRANRPHIAFFGRRNVGKSSLINKLTNQDLALVSDVPGTTTDPVYKSMELLPVGPVVVIDTAGIDDTGSLGEMRVKKTNEVIRKTDLAVLVMDITDTFASYEKELIEKFREYQTDFLIVLNKNDLLSENKDQNDYIKRYKNFLINNLKEFIQEKDPEKSVNRDVIDNKIISVSTINDRGIDKLRSFIAKNIPETHEEPFIVGDLIKSGETVVLVTPIDNAAPKGRLILPQVQTIRDVLDHDGINVVVKERELKLALRNLKTKPRIVVTDSQAFMKVDADVPDDILMTSFSILFARYKGELELFLEGAMKMERLKPGDRILIAEACTHRRQSDDIGTVKIPRWLRQKVGNDLSFTHVSGREYPDNLKDYDLILHCGACMLNRKEVLSRLYEARKEGIPVINYGMAIAALHGILERALKPFPYIYERWLELIEEGSLV